MTTIVDTPVHDTTLPQPEVAPVTDAEVPAPEIPALVDGVRHSLAADTPATNGVLSDPFKLDSKFAYTPRKMRVVTIGAGFSGLLMAHKFQHRFPEMREIVEHVIFEARSDVGGTWLANDYPGVQCDVPAHIYVRNTLILWVQVGNQRRSTLANIGIRLSLLIQIQIGPDFMAVEQTFCHILRPQ
jgi:hypothetical protein